MHNNILLKQLTFKVILSIQQPLLLGTTCTELGLITMNCIHTATSGSTELVTQYDVFTGLACLEDEYRVDLNSDVRQIQLVPSRVPSNEGKTQRAKQKS